MRKRRSQTRLGKFWLTQRPGRPSYYVTWFDERSGQTRRATTGTSDIAEAERKLAEHFQLVETLAHERPQDVPLATILERYYREHASKLVSRAQARIAIDAIRAEAGDIMVAEFNKKKQGKVREALEARGWSEQYIARTFSTAKAALRRAVDNEEIAQFPPILKFSKGESRDRVLSIDECVSLFDAAGTESQWLYLVIAFATAARPTAILELTRAQLDFESKAIRLNPRGRKQTKKRRPVIPMTPTLREWLEDCGPGYVLAHGETHLPYSRDGWRAIFGRLTDRAKVEDASLYTIRHTVATEMARRGVSDFEIKAMLGHTALSSGATGSYLHVRPDYLQNAVKAIEALLEEIGRKTKRAISRRVLEEQPHPDDVLRAQPAWLRARNVPKSPRTSGALALAIAPNSLIDERELVVGMRGFEPPTPTSRSQENTSKINSEGERTLATASTENQSLSDGNVPITCPSGDEDDGEPPSTKLSDEEGAP